MSHGRVVGGILSFWGWFVQVGMSHGRIVGGCNI
jgi:hypothetical protein